MAIKNYTTTIDVYKSLAEIQGALASHGARKIMVDYDAAGMIEDCIENTPTIDAVPVVRCARCRHGEAFKTFPGGIFCPYIKDTVPPDGYCYMGEENPHD